MANDRMDRARPGHMEDDFEEAGHKWDLSSLQANLRLGPRAQSDNLPEMLRHRNPQPSWKLSSNDPELEEDIHELLSIHNTPGARHRQAQQQMQSGFPQYTSAPRGGFPNLGQRSSEPARYSNALDAPDHGQQQMRRMRSGKRRRSDVLGKYGKDFEIPQDVKEEPEGMMGEDPEWTPDQEDSPRIQPRALR